MRNILGFILLRLKRLDGYFDKALFISGLQGIYNLFLDRAINGEAIIHAA